MYSYNLEHVSGKFQQLEITQDANDASMFISSQQQQIAVLDNELQASHGEYILLKKKYDIIAGDVGKQQTLGRLQNQIDKLEKSDFENQRTITQLTGANQKLTLSESSLHDQLLIAHSKYNDLKKLYEKNIMEMKPVLESGLNSSKANQEVINNLKYEMSGIIGHYQLSEKQFKAQESELLQLRQEVSELKTITASQELMINQLKKDSEKRLRLSLVAVAAKATREDEAKLLERLLGKSKLISEKLKKENRDTKLEITETEEYILQLQKLIDDSHVVHEQLDNQVKVKETEMKGMELEIQKLKGLIDVFNMTGMTQEKEVEWKQQEELVKQQKDRITKYSIQGRKYQARINELELHVQELEALLGGKG